MRVGRILKDNYVIPIVCIVLALVLSSAIANAMGPGSTGPDISGEFNQTVNLSLNGGGLALGITDYRLALDQNLRQLGINVHGHAHVSVKGWYNHDVSDGTLLELDEAYIDIYRDLFDLRLGQQVVSWGAAYGLNPTDYINPIPLTSVSDQGGFMDISGLPVPAIYVSAYPSWKDTSFEADVALVLNPRFQELPIPGFPIPETPKSFVDRLEIAGRIGKNFGMWDLYISGFRGWEDMPVLWFESFPPGGDSPFLIPKTAYRKATSFGASASGTSGPYTFWGEGSYTFPDKMKELDIPSSNSPISSNDSYFQVVAGADRMFGDAGQYYLMGQYIYNSQGSLLSPYNMPGEEVKAGHYLAAIARATIHDDHEIELLSIYGISDDSGIVVPKYTYKINPIFSAWIGTTFLVGDEGGEFGSLSEGKSAVAGIKAVW